MKIESKSFLPVEIVFHANWWHKNYGLDFGWDYFFDPEHRVNEELKMSRILVDTFGPMGYQHPAPRPEPIIGPVHLAAGFIMSAIWGCNIEYYPDASPQVVAQHLTIQQVDALPEPDPMQCREFAALVGMIDALQQRFGYVKGDIGWGALQNLALDLMGENLFMAYFDQPDLVRRVYEKLNRSTLEVVNYIRKRTGTSSITVNRSIENVEPAINLNSNCSVQMISNQQYEDFILPHEIELAKNLQPYGVHHCGNNMHTVAQGYAKIPDCCFFDVGWGADLAYCRKLLPDAFFNIRLSPVKIKECTARQVQEDTETLLKQAGDLSKVGLCCINMDYGTSLENLAALFATAEKYRKIGA